MQKAFSSLSRKSDEKEKKKKQEVGDELSICVFRVTWLWRHLHQLTSALWTPQK